MGYTEFKLVLLSINCGVSENWLLAYSREFYQEYLNSGKRDHSPEDVVMWFSDRLSKALDYLVFKHKTSGVEKYQVGRMKRSFYSHIIDRRKSKYCFKNK